MSLIEQKTYLKKTSFNFKRMYPNKKKVRSDKEGLCPDCGETLRIDGRCWYCAYCGWSTCPQSIQVFFTKRLVHSIGPVFIFRS